MLRVTIISAFLIALVSCYTNSPVEGFNYQRDTPEWLKEKINGMENQWQYGGTVVYRYEWKGKFVYVFSIPISSCILCDTYDEDGNKIKFTDDAMVQDFLINRKNEIVIYGLGW